MMPAVTGRFRSGELLDERVHAGHNGIGARAVVRVGGITMTKRPEPAIVSEQERYLAAAASLILEFPAHHEFINADIHHAMRVDGWPELSEPRRFGPMLLRLRKGGFIEKLGSQSTPARSHGGVTSVWRRTALMPD